MNMAKTYKIMYVPQSLHPLPNRFSYFPKKSGIFKSLTVAGGGGGGGQHVAIFELQQGAKKVSFIACHSGKL